MVVINGRAMISRVTMMHRSKPWRSREYLQAALGADCLHCGERDGTVVACHLRLKGFCGTGTKPPDFMTLQLCARCHDKLDGRAQPSWQHDWEHQLRLLCRTLERRFSEGVIR